MFNTMKDQQQHQQQRTRRASSLRCNSSSPLQAASPVTLLLIATVVVVALSAAPSCTAWTTTPFVSSTGRSNLFALQNLQTRLVRGHGISSSSSSRRPGRLTTTLLWLAVELNEAAAAAVNASSASAGVSIQASEEDDDDDDDEYEYVEYDSLTEREFIGSEWLVGTNWDRNPGRIDETWARLAVDGKGKNVVIWGDKSEGVWTLDVATQFLSLSKENLLAGKEIWACTITDYYYLQGTVRGWKYWSAAEVVGQWQAKRLGVDSRDEAGTPPWFEEEGGQQ